MQEDIIIIGAGPAGLMTAYELAKAGKPCLILEARDRSGGRICTRCSHAGSLLETGAEFVHGKLPITLSLLEEAGLSYTATSGRWVEVKGGSSAEASDGKDWPLFMEKLKGLEDDITLQAFLERHFADPRYAALNDRAISYAEGYDSADASRVSAKAVYQEWSKEQETEYRIDLGYSALTDFLAHQCSSAGCRFILSREVSRIEARDSGLIITAGGQEFSSGKAAVALPLGVLQRAGAIEFFPAATDYARAIQQAGYGDVIKFLLQFREAFWEAVYPGLGFLLSGAAVPTWWTQAPARNGVLTGWISGRAARASAHLPDEQLLDAALGSLAGIFSMDIAELRRGLVEHHIANWSNEPFTLGAYAYATPGAAAIRALLSKPMHDRIFFAGEYMYDGPAMGTVEAALWSGRETARALLAS